MGSLVPAEAGRVAEHAAALWAEERFLSGVGALVALEGGELGEAFAAEVATIWLVGSVDALVAGQRRGAREGLAAVLAQEGPFPRVGALVVLEVFQFSIRLIANLTLIGAQAGVSAAMLPEHRGVSKALAALAAGIRLLARVGALVDPQLGEGAITLVALLTPEGQISGVPGHVDSEADGLHEGLATLVAHKGFLAAVAAPMVAQLRRRLVGFAAKGALMRALRLVAELVLPELPAVGELLSAAGAGEFANQVTISAGRVGLQVTQHTRHTREGLAARQALVAPPGLDVAGLFLIFLQLHLHTFLFLLGNLWRRCSLKQTWKSKLQRWPYHNGNSRQVST